MAQLIAELRGGGGWKEGESSRLFKLPEIALPAARRNKAKKNATLSRFHSDQKHTDFPFSRRSSTTSHQFVSALEAAPFQTALLSLQLQRQPGLAAASPPQGFNEPHFHGGGDTSSFRRREATKKWSGLCQPRRPCQLRQTSRISLLESARNSRTSYEMRRCIIVRLIFNEILVQL